MRIFARVLFVLVLVFGQGVSVHAAASGLKISEIMYDPAGSDSNREWVEVYNSGSAGIDLAGHFFLTDGLSSSHHSLAAQGASVIPAGGYAVIVQTVEGFKADYPSYSGLIFDSSWSGLTATAGKTLAVIDSSGAVLDQVTYDPTIGATNDGNSLQLNGSGAWVTALPTPGATSSDSTTDTTNTDSGDTTGDTTSTTNPPPAPPGGSSAPAATGGKVVSPKAKEMKITLTLSKIATTGVPTTISYSTFGYDGEKRYIGTVHIALGDGTARDGKPEDTFEYRYDFPGTYVVLLEYRSNPYTKIPDIVERSTITVSTSSVSISAVSADGAITLLNSGKTEADISRWKLGPLTGTPVFDIPDGTILLPGKTILLPQSLTGLSPHAPSLAVILPSGIVAATYGDMSDNASPDVPVVTETPAVQKILSEAVEAPIVANVLTSTQSPETPAPVPENTAKKHSLLPFVIGLAGVILVACFGLWKWKIFDTASVPETIPQDSTALKPKEENTAEIIHIVEE